ncbi:MAG: 3-oxoacyl-ACP reductase [Acidiferrobacteraceae bacterium]|jgi:NAD(P)-dependent dehydrogenase (short-subunit alcohol dehydrogenase family)|nr:3-oxoacyl-ACP reductase [Acidiferrobacteraceae bacterium]MDP6552332.1 SDR family oxidoreductase [Arenicellales bacterium]MDP6790381.1 SDR family oxidoreductase [Arenicellales bacterium]MDP6918145.1 SDR family oxidoreductase [Arenicellales bacterium]
MSVNKVAVVTAGGGGIGRAIALELRQREFELALMSRSEACEETAAEVGGLAVRGSVTEAADLSRLTEAALERFGRIDAVVCHTAHPPKGDLLAIEDEAWHQGLDMLILNVVRLARLITPVMERQGSGAWVNISTFAAFEPEQALPVSCTLRAGLSAFAKLYADRYAGANIRMNNVLPGFIDSLQHKESVIPRIPLGRIGTVDEIAKTTAFLLSDDAGYITGQNLIVDGGITRHL